MGVRIKESGENREGKGVIGRRMEEWRERRQRKESEKKGDGKRKRRV